MLTVEEAQEKILSYVNVLEPEGGYEAVLSITSPVGTIITLEQVVGAVKVVGPLPSVRVLLTDENLLIISSEGLLSNYDKKYFSITVRNIANISDNLEHAIFDWDKV